MPLMRTGSYVKFGIGDNCLLRILGPSGCSSMRLRDSLQAQAAMLGAHRAPDGSFVGIFQAESIDPVSGRVIDPHVVVLAKDTGENIRYPLDGRNELLALSPDTLIDLKPRQFREDIPPGRLVGSDPIWVANLPPA